MDDFLEIADDTEDFLEAAATFTEAFADFLTITYLVNFSLIFLCLKKLFLHPTWLETHAVVLFSVGVVVGQFGNYPSL